MLFSDQRKHSIQVPTKDAKGNAVTVGWLVHHLCEEVMIDTRKELFVLDDHVYVLSSFSPLLNGSLSSNQGLPHFLSHAAMQCAISWSGLSSNASKLPPAYFLHRFSPCRQSTKHLKVELAAALTDNSTMHIVAQESLFLSTMLTGSSKAKHHTFYSPMTIYSLSLHFMEADTSSLRSHS